jgi:hypothetical protein
MGFFQSNPSTQLNTTISTMAASVLEHNNRIVRSVMRSAMTLPSMVVLWKSKDPALERNYTAVLCTLDRVKSEHYGIWTFTLVEHPMDTLGYGSITLCPEDSWFFNDSHDILVKRASSRPEEDGKFLHTTIEYNSYVLKLQNGDRIPFVHLSNPCRVLPCKFMNLTSPTNASWSFQAIPGRSFGVPATPPPVAPRASAPPAPRKPSAPAPTRSVLETQEYKELEEEAFRRLHQNAQLSIENEHLQKQLKELQQPCRKLPQRIVNGFIEGTLINGYECPIDMCPIEKQHACLTPCGHVLTYSSASRWIEGAHSCPECRSPLEVEQLQRWKP